MGDRTYACIIVNTAYAELVDYILTKQSDRVDETEDCETEKKYIVYEANYGDIPWLETLLEKCFIPYDKFWEAGSEFGPSAKHVRVKHGGTAAPFQLITKSYSDSEAYLDAQTVVRLLEDDPKALWRWAASAVDDVAPLTPKLSEIALTPFHKVARHQIRLRKVREAGRQARLDQKSRVPSQSERFRELIEGYSVGDGADELAKAWLEAFDQATLAMSDDPTTGEEA